MKCTGTNYLLLLIFLVTGCQAAPVEVISSSPMPPETATTIPTSAEHTPIEPTPTDSPEPSRTPEASHIEICSPLGNFTFVELENSVVNPYFPPPPGDDHPHQGVDLAVRDELTHVAIAGESVLAILTGEVKMVIPNRFPYGNAILVETALQGEFELDKLLNPVPTAWAEVNPDPALTCPIYDFPILMENRRSIYILYAHLQETPSYKKGSGIKCGEVIGNIGMSGNALNPHVHIEARIGPSGAAFEGMAHYEGSATPKEMGTYCQWRVNGSFQHFDPMLLLQYLLDTPHP